MVQRFKAAIMLILVSVVASPAWSYDYRCPRGARDLNYAAENYESALSEYEDAVSSYESACESGYGYSNDDESACGPYGYERTAYEDAVENLRSAESDLEDAYENVRRRCNPPDSNADSTVIACMVQLSKASKELSTCLSKLSNSQSK